MNCFHISRASFSIAVLLPRNLKSIRIDWRAEAGRNSDTSGTFIVLEFVSLLVDSLATWTLQYRIGRNNPKRVVNLLMAERFFDSLYAIMHFSNSSWIESLCIFNNLHFKYFGGDWAGISGFFFSASVNADENTLFGTGLIEVLR